MTDYALGRPEVDPERIALLGISQAGRRVPRGRFLAADRTAAVADPGVFDVAAAWTGHPPPPMRELPDAGAKDQLDEYLAEDMKEDPAL